MPITDVSPSAENYQVGKGIVAFKPDGQSVYIDIGNVPQLEFKPNITKLDHFSSRQGIKTKDRSVVIERGGTLRILMEELTSENLAMVLMGTIGGTALVPTIEIMANDTIRGELKFTATNDVGPRWDLHFYNVEFSPSGSFNPISNEWNQIEVTGEVLVAQPGHAQAGKVGLATLTNSVGAGTKATGVLTLAGNAVNNETVTIGGRTYTWKTSPSIVPDTVKIGVSASDSIDNLIAAINGDNGAGTLYGTGTLPHSDVDAVAGAGDTMNASAKLGGTAGNSIVTTETMTAGSWGSGTLTGGAA
jgi:hypothetical protein